MTSIEIWNYGKLGVISDIPAHLLPLEAWSGARNMRFSKRGARRMAGHSQVFGSLSGSTPEFLFNVPALGASYWLYANLTDVYVYESGVHTEITRSSGGDYATVDGRDWNGTILGGIPLLNNGTDVPQYWPTLNPGTTLANLPNWPAALRAGVIRAFGQYLFALDLTISGTRYAQALRWSHKADPGTIPDSWDIADPTKDAGQTQLTDIKGGRILDGLLLGDELIIYKENAIHAIRFVGGNDVFSPRLLISTTGALSARCMCTFDKGTKHFAAGADDIIIHAGQREATSILDDRTRNEIYGELDTATYVNSYSFDNVLTKECWFCYPTVGNTYPNRAAIWSYKDNLWTFRDWTGVSTDFGAITDAPADSWDADSQIWDLDSETWSTETRIAGLFADRAGSKVYKLDAGLPFGSAAPPLAYLERTAFAFDAKDRDGQAKANFSSRKLFKRLWPKVEGTAEITVQVGTQDVVDGPIDWAPAQVFNPAVDQYLDFYVNGRFLAYRFESRSDEPWELQGLIIDVERVSEM